MLLSTSQWVTTSDALKDRPDQRACTAHHLLLSLRLKSSRPCNLSHGLIGSVHSTDKRPGCHTRVMSPAEHAFPSPQSTLNLIKKFPTPHCNVTHTRTTSPTEHAFPSPLHPVVPGHTHEFHYTSATAFTFRPHSAHTQESSLVKSGRDGIELVSRVIQTWRKANSQDLLSRVEVSVTNLSGERVSQVALGCHVFEPEWSLAVEKKDGRCVVPKAFEHNETHRFEYITEGVRAHDFSIAEVRGSYGEVVKGAGMFGNMYSTVGAMCVVVLVASTSVGWYAFGPNKDRRAAVYTRILTREKTFRMAHN
jgi:hypothetical protein